MGGFFNYDNPVWRFVGRIWDLFILNLLWVICSIPIVTFGASTTAMYYCTLKIAKDRDSGGMFTMFFHSFKDNIKQSTIIWIIMAFIGGILFFDIRFFSFYSPIHNTVIRMIIFTVTCFLILLWLFIFLYIFPIQAKFINPMIMRLPGVMSMLVLILGSGISLFQASQFNMVFDKYINEDNE